MKNNNFEIVDGYDIIDFLYQRANRCVLKLIGSIDVCFVWYSRGKFTPSLHIFEYYGEVRNTDVEQFEGYDIWLSFFCDYEGLYTNIYYPKNHKEAQEVKVLFIGTHIRIKINWIHGDRYLFNKVILPLLFLDKIERYIWKNKLRKRTSKKLNKLLKLINYDCSYELYDCDDKLYEL